MDVRVNNDGDDGGDDGSVPYLYICMLNQRPKGQ
jgi:hypothetical protein